jgi:hypothetical protein
MTGQEMVVELMKRGETVYGIAKKLSEGRDKPVSWMTVSYWKKGIWRPNPKNQKGLEGILEGSK